MIPLAMPDITPLELVLRYHQETKHDFNRYARSLGHLDWANQPNPFRRYEGAPLIRLPILTPDDDPRSPRYDDLYRAGAVQSVPVTVPALSRLFEYALALSAWKEAGGTRWALRSNPSSGNLHPTEGYLVIGGLAGLAPSPGLYHYAPKEHGLERRAEFPDDLYAALMKDFPSHAFLIGLSSVHWREAWKYGERAFRYCQHDVGHAIGAVRIAAATLGWNAVALEGLTDETIEALLGLNRPADFERAEREHPDLVMVVWPNQACSNRHFDQTCRISNTTSPKEEHILPLHLDPAVIHELSKQTWHGKANRLSHDDPVPWEIIDQVAAASRKADSEGHGLELAPLVKAVHATGTPATGPSAGKIIHQRRSLLACDGKTSIPSEGFYQMLSRVMPQIELSVCRRPMPWDTWPWNPALHLALFVHRVVGIPAGLYFLVRDPSTMGTLRKIMHEQFVWGTPPGCPSDLPLYLLEEGDTIRIATSVSCHQEIAGDGAFALGMIAEFEPALRRHGPWFYRRLFWEAGLIGQILYLEAEAAGVRATGIGCFFDDPVHRVFNFPDATFQSLYHFTVGGPVDDRRLVTLPPYDEPMG
jgi:SagB-type dehydrogenase family enzyme